MHLVGQASPDQLTNVQEFNAIIFQLQLIVAGMDAIGDTTTIIIDRAVETIAIITNNAFFVAPIATLCVLKTTLSHP